MYSDLTRPLRPVVNSLPFFWLGADAKAAAREAEELAALRRQAPEDPADG